MNLLIVIAHANTERYLRGLADACQRNTVDYSLFFTGAGVSVLSDLTVIELSNNATNSIACEHAWEKQMTKKVCPIALGSQTNLSQMLAAAGRVVSL